MLWNQILVEYLKLEIEWNFKPTDNFLTHHIVTVCLASFISVSADPVCCSKSTCYDVALR